MKSEVMERHLEGQDMIHIKQTRRACFQELLGCEAKTELKYYKNDRNEHFATSLEDADCPMRFFCSACYPYTAVVKEEGTGEEILSMERSFTLPLGSCKCCCYQELNVSSGGTNIGKIQEQCFYCVPRMLIYDANGAVVYKMHAPTCCGGVCVNCCAEGNPCGRGCCKDSYNFYEPDQEKTDGTDAPYAGRIMKLPKSFMDELFTDAVAMDVHMPKGITVERKGLLLGAAMFINTNFYENDSDES